MSTTIEDRLLRDREAAALLGVARSTFLEMVQKGDAPKPVQLPGRITRWRFSDLQGYIAGLPLKQQAA